MSVNVPKGQKVVNCTWKDDDFWYLTRPMSPKDSAEILKFECKSNMGVLEGTVTLIESK